MSRRLTVNHLRRACVALAIAAAAAPSWSQGSCGMLADPNSPACRSGTASPPSQRGSPAAAPAAGASGPAGHAPGRGQQVCAFFDRTTNRCLTVRPNTADYDSAVQTGIDAAMMGMQIQQDAIHRAGQMGVLGGVARGEAPAAVPAAARTAASVTGMSVGAPLGAVMVPPTAVGSEDTPLLLCARRKVEEVEKGAGRPATPAEVTSFLKGCAS